MTRFVPKDYHNGVTWNSSARTFFMRRNTWRVMSSSSSSSSEGYSSSSSSSSSTSSSSSSSSSTSDSSESSSSSSSSEDYSESSSSSEEYSESSSFGYTTSSSSSSSSYVASCPRVMGGNWQRKLWYCEPGENFWRGRFDPDDSKLKFDWINTDDLATGNWTENTNAQISVTNGSNHTADFSVRGCESGIPFTIVYASANDVYVAECDEASDTGWAWENTTKVLDGSDDGGVYTKVGIAANRQPQVKLWVTAVLDDTTNIYIRGKLQTSSGDITGWGATDDISDSSNTDPIYGQSIRSMGGGAETKDMLVVYKEDDSLKSVYIDNSTPQAEQVIDVATKSGSAYYDFEHGEEAGVKDAHVVFVDADGSVQWTERAAGAASTWDTNLELDDASGKLYGGMGIVERDDFFYVSWADKTQAAVEWRLHDHDQDTWTPALGEEAHHYFTATATTPTATLEQLQTADNITVSDKYIMTWVGQGDNTWCDFGYGLIDEFSSSSSSSIDSSSSSSSSEDYSESTTSESTQSSSSSSPGEVESESSSSSSSSSEDDNPGWKLRETQTPSTSASNTFTLPSGISDAMITFDVGLSDDGENCLLEIEIGGSFYQVDASHRNISNSSGSSYVGATTDVLNYVGNAAGEGASQTIVLYGVDSTTLYPCANLTGGYISAGGNSTMAFGATARKTAGAITAIRLSPSGGTITGTIKLYTFTNRL